DRLVAIPLGAELEVREAGRRGEAEGPQALAVVEGPDVAGLGAQRLRRPGAEALRHTRLPQVRRLIHVRVRIEDRIVDAGGVVDEVRHVRSIARALAARQGSGEASGGLAGHGRGRLGTWPPPGVLPAT